MNNLDQLFVREYQKSPLREQYEKLKQEKSLRRRDMADELQVSEAELVDQQCDVKSVRLNKAFAELIRQLPALGYIMTLTRNDHAVHERKGCYDNVSITGPMGLVITEDRKIDLRIILNRWKHGFAVREETEKGPRYSLQFFDETGTAIQKVFLQADSDREAYVTIVDRYRSEDQTTPLEFNAITDLPEYANDEIVDVEQLTQEWLAMTDVHQFFNILKKHKVSREQAFRLVGGSNAQPLDVSCVEGLLTQAAEREIPIMCFVGNRGNIQIHSGVVKNIKRMGPWLNVLDPEFNLHLMDSGVERAWLVRKPGDTGLVTSIEFYDAQSQLIAQFFGVRREGQEENPQWRELAESFLTAEQKVA